jgi:uncharacterized membrane-anchored protein YhcB (DUF1043 family)
MIHFNINTATNAELKDECTKLEKAYKEIQQDVAEKAKIMIELSEDYNKIKAVLDKREGKLAQ